MQKAMDSTPVMAERSGEWAKLIRKLRWIGLEDEAQRLQHALTALSAEERGKGSVSEGPFSTD
jgi:hypothetical protein